MKRIKKVLVIVLACSMLFSVMMTGCGSKETDKSTTDKTQTVSSPAESKAVEREQLPKELVVSSFNWGWPTVDAAKDRIGPELEKALGFKVTLNVIKVGNSDEADKKLQLWAATGAADMPDILMTTGSTGAMQTIDALGRNNMLLDWKEIIDKIPNYKEEVDYLLPICTDIQTNKLFRVPQNFGSQKSAKLRANPLIRKDWLDQLGLAVPTTTDELYEVLKAFRDKIKMPDGSKVIPMVAFGEMFWNDKYAFDNPDVPLAFIGKITGGLNDWFTGKDGKAQRADMVFTNNLVAFVSFYNKLYNENLMDKECFTMKMGQFQEKTSSGRVGAYTIWGSHVQSINDALAKANPKGLFVGCPVVDTKMNPSKTLNHTNLNKSKIDVYSYWIVKKNISKENLNGLIKYFDYTMGDEGFKLSYYGQKDVDWESTADGGYITDKAVYVLPGPIEIQKGAGYADRWKAMVVKGVMTKSPTEIRQIVTKWQETERKLGYDEIVAEKTALLSTVPELVGK